MRDLSATKLEAYQKKDSLDPIVKITLTQGVTTVTLREDVILNLSHEEEPYRASCKLVCDNSDGYFTDLALQGYKAVISYGLVTKDGEEFSDAAPLWVIAQQLDSSEGKLICTLTMVGIPNMLAEDRASESYVPDEDDEKTVKDIINDILDTSMTAFSTCVAYTVEWDSEDDLVDSYMPKDSFRIYKNGSRLAAIRRLLDYTKCVIRYGGDEKIHILEPTIPGDSYDYEYSLADTYHTFFAKAYRKTLVIPNKVVVESRDDDDPPYSGNKTDPTSYALLPKTEYRQMRLQSNAEAGNIAEAILSKYQLNAEMGAANVPMNVGAEVFDYVKVTDAREDDSRTGNIGSLTRTYSPGKYSLSFSFGDWLTVRKLLNDIETNSDAGAYFERLSVGTLYAEKILLDDIVDTDTYRRVKSVAIDSDGMVILDQVIEGTYGLTKKASLTAEGLVILEEASGTVDDIADGVTYQRTKAAALTAEGLILVDELVTGTYGLVRTTCINQGYIELNSSTRIKTGAGSEWYNESGVEIDADHGINIYGTNNALTTRATKTGAIQCYVGSDGAIYAGGGAVKLDSDGILIDNGVGGSGILSFKTGAYSGTISLRTGGNLWLYPTTGYIVSKTIRPDGSGVHDLGSSSYKWDDVWVVTLHQGDSVFANGWRLTETLDNKGMMLVRPDNSIAKEWR